MPLFLLLLSMFLVCTDVAGQRKLTKPEIMEKLVASWANNCQANKVVFSWDSTLQKRLVHLTDSLRLNGDHSFIVYVKSLPGYISTDGCITFMYPEYAYLFWQEQGQTKIRSIVGRCELSSMAASDSVFTFWEGNREVISKETLMPVIFGAEATKVGNVQCRMEIVDHEPKYLLFLKSPSGQSRLTFDENAITNKAGLFYEDNVKSKTIELWRRVNGMLKRLSLL